MDNFVRLQIEREVPSVQDMDLGSRVILLVGFAAGYRERSIVTPPKNQERRLVVTKPLLPFRVGFEVILIVVKEVQLNVPPDPAGSGSNIVYPQIRVVLRQIWRSADVPLSSCFERQQISSYLDLMGCAILPKSAPDSRKGR
jgi:hypothetical protein